MGQIYDEFQRQVEDWRRRYGGDARQQTVRLLLLALEREELVTIAYREALIMHRLQQMPISGEVRELIRHSLIWAWKDEEMHAVYLRGALLKLGNPLLRARTYLQQVVGAVAGWSSSVRQHVRWTEAPLSYALATASTWAGLIVGQVPRDVRRYLKYCPFRDFCLFNEEAERTAALCYQRLLELADAVSDLPSTVAEDYRRIRDDEERHARIFAILAAALDEHDRLVPGATPERLARQIRDVGEVFLPRVQRMVPAWENPVGSGSSVWVMRGTSAEEKLPLFSCLLDDAGLAARLAERARSLGKKVHDLHVAVKVSFMLGYDRRDLSAVTDPALIGALARSLQQWGCRDVAVVEARNLYDGFYANRTVLDVARYFGIDAPDYRVVDSSTEQVPYAYRRGMAQYSVGRTWKEADFRITFGKMSSHPVDMVHLGIANLAGLGARVEEFMFTERQAHRDAAIMTLADAFPPHFALLDAYDQVADGLMGYIACPRPRVPRRLYAGADALAVDLVAARHMGEQRPQASLLLRTATHWFGDPSPRIEVIGVDAPVHGWRGPYHSEWSTLLSFLAYPVYQCASGRGALFLPEMDEAAFPRIRAESLWFRLGNRAVRRLLGLRLPP
jgi:uncharacterized protein (DUF362 family)